jgi:hypothetical protein
MTAHVTPVMKMVTMNVSILPNVQQKYHHAMLMLHVLNCQVHSNATAIVDGLVMVPAVPMLMNVLTLMPAVIMLDARILLVVTCAHVTPVLKVMLWMDAPILMNVSLLIAVIMQHVITQLVHTHVTVILVTKRMMKICA